MLLCFYPLSSALCYSVRLSFRTNALTQRVFDWSMHFPLSFALDVTLWMSLFSISFFFFLSTRSFIGLNVSSLYTVFFVVVFFSYFLWFACKYNVSLHRKIKNETRKWVELNWIEQQIRKAKERYHTRLLFAAFVAIEVLLLKYCYFGCCVIVLTVCLLFVLRHALGSDRAVRMGLGCVHTAFGMVDACNYNKSTTNKFNS